VADPIHNSEQVLAFWFALERPGKKDDAAVRVALGPLVERALRGELAAWVDAPRPRLALVILLDQATRHMYRDRPESYAGDAAAQALTRRFLDLQDWQGFTTSERYCALAPGLHAEDLALQERVQPEIQALAREDPALRVSAGIADLYRDTIRRFGRFPHRNAILGRASTAEELRFLGGEWKERRRALYGNDPR
jgi:uncharacterized protein (DUF924 family)